MRISKISTIPHIIFWCNVSSIVNRDVLKSLKKRLNKIDIDPDSNLFFFLASMQDEVHRFAINYHKKLRQKNMYRSKLDGIEGLGEKSRLKLLRKYKTITNISRQSVEELSTVLPLKVAERLYNSLRENKNDTEPE